MENLDEDLDSYFKKSIKYFIINNNNKTKI